MISTRMSRADTNTIANLANTSTMNNRARKSSISSIRRMSRGSQNNTDKHEPRMV